MKLFINVIQHDPAAPLTFLWEVEADKAPEEIGFAKLTVTCKRCGLLVPMWWRNHPLILVRESSHHAELDGAEQLVVSHDHREGGPRLRPPGRCPDRDAIAAWARSYRARVDARDTTAPDHWPSDATAHRMVEDVPKGAIRMAIIYDHPTDCPAAFAVRERFLLPGGVAQISTTASYHDTIDEARAALHPSLTTCIPRSPLDDTGIVESWI